MVLLIFLKLLPLMLILLAMLRHISSNICVNVIKFMNSMSSYLLHPPSYPVDPSLPNEESQREASTKVTSFGQKKYEPTLCTTYKLKLQFPLTGLTNLQFPLTGLTNLAKCTSVKSTVLLIVLKILHPKIALVKEQICHKIPITI